MDSESVSHFSMCRYSPLIKEIKVIKHRKVRRAKLYYLRDKLPRFCTFKWKPSMHLLASVFCLLKAFVISFPWKLKEQNLFWPFLNECKMQSFVDVVMSWPLVSPILIVSCAPTGDEFGNVCKYVGIFFPELRFLGCVLIKDSGKKKKMEVEKLKDLIVRSCEGSNCPEPLRSFNFVNVFSYPYS